MLTAKCATSCRSEEEDVQHLESQGLENQEVGGPDHLRVIGEKGAPTLARRWRMAASPVAPDRAGTDDNAELEELTADALGAPEPVLARHGGDQFPNLGTQSRPTQVVTRAPAPVEAPAAVVPADDGLWADQDQMLLPIALEAAGHQPEDTIPGL